MANERLYQFPAKPAPVPGDLIYCGDSANGFNEVNITIAQLVASYPNLAELGLLSITASAVLVSSAGGVQSFATTLPAALTIPQPNIVGVTTNSDAAALSVGQLASTVIASGAPVALTTTVVANVTSVSLTAGDWDVYGNVAFTIGGNCTEARCWISATTATQPDASLVSANTTTGSLGALIGLNAPFYRAKLSGTTTIYLSAVSTFSTSTVDACGGIYARRRR